MFALQEALLLNQPSLLKEKNGHLGPVGQNSLKRESIKILAFNRTETCVISSSNIFKARNHLPEVRDSSNIHGKINR